MMTEVIEEVLKCSLRWKRGIYLVFGLIFLALSLVLLSFMSLFLRSYTNCHSSSSDFDKGMLCGGIAIIMFLFGVFFFSLLYDKNSEQNSSPQVVFSEIRAAPLLPH